MSEITKLYENADVLKECLSPCYINKAWRKTHDCPNCDNRENYPPFTAEKLINLEMFLINKGDFDIKKGSVDITFESFTSCIAGLINNLWQSLTQEERKQIKIILQEDNQ